MPFVVTKDGHAYNIARADCRKCHGTGITMSDGVPVREESAYRFTASWCDCVKVTFGAASRSTGEDQ